MIDFPKGRGNCADDPGGFLNGWGNFLDDLGHS